MNIGCHLNLYLDLSSATSFSRNTGIHVYSLVDSHELEKDDSAQDLKTLAICHFIHLASTLSDRTGHVYLVDWKSQIMNLASTFSKWIEGIILG